MKYLVTGLGNLGRAIAKDLTRVGNEVIGVDMDLHRVDMLKNDTMQIHVAQWQGAQCLFVRGVQGDRPRYVVL